MSKKCIKPSHKSVNYAINLNIEHEVAVELQFLFSDLH